MADEERQRLGGEAAEGARLEQALAVAFSPCLAASVGPPSFCSGPAVPDAPPADALPASEGRYILGPEIGRGGTAVVYAARDRDLLREVAIKVLRPEHAGRGVRERFLRAARMEGSLAHPGMVPLYDLTGEESPAPVLAMRLIRGEPLSRRLANRHDPTDALMENLGIFRRICEAVGYAHSRGVIHRDLKPGNVLVGAFGEVLVVDWGFSRSLSGDPEPPGVVVGTPAYMPPEQARGQAADARSDVFSLGAVLLEILTGAPPHPRSALPETREDRLAGALERLDACRADAELVALCRACLDPAPDRRPRDAGEVAKAVGDHLAALDHRRVEAELAAAREKVRRQEAQRAADRERRRANEERTARRLAIGLSIALLAAVATGGGFAVLRARSADARAQAAAARVDEALREASRMAGAGDILAAESRAREAVERAHSGGTGPEVVARAEGFLAHLDEEARETRRREAREERLDRLANRLKGLFDHEYLSLARDPVAADAAFARAFGESDLAPPALTPEALAAEIAGTPRSDEIACALFAWAEARAGLGPEAAEGTERLRTAARLAASEPLRGRLAAAAAAEDLDTLWRLARDEEAARDPGAFTGLLAVRLRDGGRPQDAIALLTEAWRARPGDAFLVERLAACLMAEPLDVEAGARYGLAAVALAPDSACALSNLAGCLLGLGEIDRAETVSRLALSLSPRHPEHDLTFGEILAAHGRWEESVAVYRAILEDDPTYFRACTNIVHPLLELSRREEALEMAEEAVRLAPERWQVQAGLAQVLLALGRFAEAEAPSRKALELNPDAGQTHGVLARVLESTGRMDEAMAEYRECLRRLPGDRLSSRRLALILRQARCHAEAVEILGAAVERHPEWVEGLVLLGGLLLESRRPQEALAPLEQALKVAPQDHGALVNLGGALASLNRFEEAMTVLQEAVRTDPEDALAHRNLGVALHRIGRYAEALPAFRTALSLAPEDENCRRGVAMTLFGLGRFDEARTVAEECLARPPVPVSVATALAWSLVLSRNAQGLDPGRALRLLDDPALKSARDPALKALRGLALVLAGDAAAGAQAVAEPPAGAPTALFLLVRALADARRGDLPRARRWLEESAAGAAGDVDPAILARVREMAEAALPREANR